MVIWSFPHLLRTSVLSLLHRERQILIARTDLQSLAQNHHPGGTGPPKARELRLSMSPRPLLTPQNNAIKGRSAGRSPLADGLLHCSHNLGR